MKRHWIGPLLSWEIIRLGRRGNVTILRTLVAALMLLALYIYYLTNSPDDQFLLSTWRMKSAITQPSKSELAAYFLQLLNHFAQEFCQYLLVCEVIFVILLTPVYIAGAIAEERDRKTLEFLLSTDLSAWEIIVGKLGSRLLQLTNVLLVCFPVLAIMQVWGGVNIRLVAAMFGVAMVSMISTAAFSISASLRGTTLVKSLIRCYVPLALFHFFFLSSIYWHWFWQLGSGEIAFMSPIVCAIGMMRDPNVLTTFPPVFYLALEIFIVSNLLLTLYFLWDATRNLRKLAFNSKPRKIVQRQAKNPEKRHWADPPALKEDEDGLFWKEKYFSGTQNRFVKQLTLIPTWLWIAITVTLGMLLMTTFSGEVIAAASSLTKYAGLFFLFAFILVVGMAASASVARERQKETIVDLVMIPTDRGDILDAKLWGSLIQGRSVFGGFVSLLFVGAFCMGISIFALPGLIVLSLVWGILAASIGIWLSVRARSVQRASSLWILLVIALFGSSFLVAKAVQINFSLQEDPYGFFREPQAETWYDKKIASECLVVLSPILTWDRLSFDIDDGSNTFHYYGEGKKLDNLTQLIAPAINLLGLLFLSFLFRRLALKRFRNETYK